VNDGFDLLPSGLSHDDADRRGMVVQRGLIERPWIRREIDAGSPVLEPHVVAGRDQVLDE